MNRKQRRAEEANKGKDFSGRLKRANLALAARLDETYATMDEGIQRSLEKAGQTERVSCRKGCAHCCELFVLVSGPEAVLIATRHPAAVKRATPRLLEQERLMLDMGVQDVDFEDIKQRDFFAGRWFDERIRCAFLNEANECSIYVSRPHACRSYIVLDVDPEQCARRPDFRNGEEILIPGHQSIASFHASGNLVMEMERRYKGTLVMGPLQNVVLAAVEERI